MSIASMIGRVAFVAGIGAGGFVLWKGLEVSMEMDVILKKLDSVDQEFTGSKEYSEMQEAYLTDKSATLVAHHNGLQLARRALAEARLVGAVSKGLVAWFSFILDKRYALTVVA